MSKEAEAWLTLAAHLGAAPIPRWMLADSRAAGCLRAALSLIGVPAGATAPDPASILAELQQQLKSVSISDTAITLTSECRESALARVRPDGSRSWIELALDYVYAFAPMNSDDPTTWATWRALEPHVRHVIDLAACFDIRFPTGRLLGEGLGVFIYLTGSEDEALQMFRRALEIDELHFGAGAPEVAVDLNNLAFALRHAGEGAKADELLTRSLQILSDHEKDRPSWFAIAVGNMADMLHGLGRDEEAEQLYRRAAAVEPDPSADQQATPGRNLRRLGDFLTATGRAKEAEEVARQALATDERLLGPEHPSVAADIRDLADLAIRDTDPAMLLPLLRRAVEIDRKTFSAGDAALIADRLRLAYTCVGAGVLDEAGDVLAEIDALPDESLIPVGAAAQDALMQFVDIRVKQDRVEDAIAAARRLVRLLEAAKPLPAKKLAETRGLIASLLIRIGRSKEAQSLMADETERALRQHLGAHPKDVDALNSLGVLLKNERADYAGAEKCYRDVLAIDPENAHAWNNLAVLLGSVSGRYDEAEAAYRKSLERNPADPNTLANYALLIQNEKRDFAVAAGLYRMALETGKADAAAHANFASLTICMGEIPAAIDLLKQGWALQAGRHDRCSARILFLRAAIERLEGRTAQLFLGQLHTLFDQGIAHAAWPVRSVMQVLADRLGPEDLELFRSLSAAIDSRGSAADLAASARWAAISALPLDTPWDAVLEV